MRKEVSSAVDFLTQLMRSSTKDEEKLSSFNENLKRRICEHYQDHWFPEKPFKGSGYRCLRINHYMEPMIIQAAADSGLTRDDLMSMLPNELTLWIDPREVSYRIGEDGSVGILYQEEDDGSRKPSPKPVNRSPVPNRSPIPSHSPVNVSPARSPVQPRTPVHSPIPAQYHSPQRQLNSPSSADFISWDLFEPSLSPSRFQHFAQQYQQQQCSRDAYFQQHTFNDTYDLKRLAAFVYS